MAYVYLHRRNDTLDVFYIGISLKDDSKYKRAYSKKRTNKHRHNIVNKVGYSVIILKDNIKPEEAKLLEIALIKYYGRSNLSNATDGGEGVLGLIHTEERKLNHSEFLKGNDYNKGKINPPRTEEAKIKYSESKKGEKNPNFGKSTWNKNKKMSEESKQKMLATRAANKAKKKI